MKLFEEIIIRPYITEKSTMESAFGKYTFVVDKRATKTEIRMAVEHLFDVKVLKVTTMNYEGKEKRMGVHVGRRADWKKAIVKIDTNPQAEVYLSENGSKVSNAKKYKTEIAEFNFVN